MQRSDRVQDNELLEHNEILDKVTSLIKEGHASVMIDYILTQCKNKDLQSFLGMFTFIIEAYYKEAIDKWKLMDYVMARSYFGEASNFCCAITAGVKDNKLRESISIFYHFFESLNDLVTLDYVFQRVFDSTDFTELLASCIMTAEIALNLDILKKANEKRKYLDKLKDKFPAFHVFFNVQMFCLFSLLNTLISTWGNLLNKDGKEALSPNKFKLYESDLDFEKCRYVLLTLGFNKAKQVLDALENFILLIKHYDRNKKWEDLTSEEIIELFGILNAGSMRASKSYIGFAVKGIEELKQKQSEIEKLVSKKMKKEFRIVKSGGEGEAKGEKAELRPEPKEKKEAYLVFLSRPSGIGTVKKERTEISIQKNYLNKKEKYDIFIYGRTVYKKIKIRIETKIEQNMVTVDLDENVFNLLLIFLIYKDKPIFALPLYHKACEGSREHKSEVISAVQIMDDLKQAVSQLRLSFEEVKDFDIPRARGKRDRRGGTYFLRGKFKFCAIIEKSSLNNYIFQEDQQLTSHSP